MDKKFRSQAQIADVLGIPRRTLSSYCTGHRKIGNIDTRKKLLELTGIEFFKSDKPDIQEAASLNEWMKSVIDRSMINRRDVDNSSNIDGKTDKDNLNNGGRPFLNMMSELRNWFNNQNQWSNKQEFADYMGIPRSTMKKIFLGVREPKGEYRQKLYQMTQLECFKDVNQESQYTNTDTAPSAKIEIKIDQGKRLIDVEQKGQTGQLIGESKQPTEEPIPLIEHSRQLIKEPKLLIKDSKQLIMVIKRIDEDLKRLIEQTECYGDDTNNLKENTVKPVNINPGDEVDKLAKIFYSLARALEPFKCGTPEQRKKVKEKILPEDFGYVMSFMQAMYHEDSFKDFMFFAEYDLKGDK